MRTIDITPTWSALLPSLIELAHKGETAEARRVAREELAKMARVADRFADEHKSNTQQNER